MVTIEYCSEGKPISEFDLEEFVRLVKLSVKYDFYLKISTSAPFLALSIAIIKGVIDYKQVVFKINNIVYELDKYGWPGTIEGFCNIEKRLVEEREKAALQVFEREHREEAKNLEIRR